ncbi:hypothetical protein [Photobacterium sp. 1_MG-2023]|uniref:hypothetical protein n=1 Tax=Photobacterium sp. 1_MG-2023 TaxID=3062646 RepID=UPI0026E35C87|nr:hypothetical protein [Photobacterium sp. 1_MG-2023]MDO6708529.1 hypothetical protein [Photobacterium sp. 1_MG-2023]
MFKIKSILLCLMTLIFTSSAWAKEYWIDTSGKVFQIATYATTETILVYLDTSGSDVAECSDKQAFAISNTLSSEARSRMYSMLLAAKTAGTPVTVSYTNVGSCEVWGTNNSAYRRIMRLM